MTYNSVDGDVKPYSLTHCIVIKNQTCFMSVSWTKSYFHMNIENRDNNV